VHKPGLLYGAIPGTIIWRLTIEAGFGFAGITIGAADFASAVNVCPQGHSHCLPIEAASML